MLEMYGKYFVIGNGKIIVQLVSQCFSITFSAGFNREGSAELISGGDRRSREHLSTESMNLFQKLESVARKIFFQKKMSNGNRRIINMKDNDLANVNRRILQDDIFDVKQVVISSFTILKIVYSTA